MRLYIEITAPNAVVKSGVKNGTTWQLVEQFGFVSYPSGERRRGALLLESGDPDLKPGVYEATEDAVYAGDFGVPQISMRAKHWQPVKVKL